MQKEATNIEEKPPIHIIGTIDEDLDREVKERIRRTVEHAKTHPPITEVTITIKHQRSPYSLRYQLSARAPSATEQFIAKAEGQNLREALDELTENLDKALRHVEHPENTPRKWAVFLR